MERWSGKTAVVTGASAGIGAGVCVALANCGLTVVGLARRTHMIDELSAQVTGTGRIVSRQCDVSNLEDIAAAFSWVEQHAGGTDVVVNNAGVIRPGHITDIGNKKLTDEDIVSTIDINFRAVVMCTRRAVESMRARNVHGHIFNINSVAGHYYPFSPEFNVYPATKHAVTAATRALLNELAAFQSTIKVTSISPGLVATEMTSQLLSQQPLAALQPRDVAAAVVYALGTPDYVNVSEIKLHCVAEKLL